MRKITVVDYDPEWGIAFKAFKTYYQNLFQGIKCDILHVGSTSVEGLAAKPIIDIDIVVNNEAAKKKIIQKLESVGYTHQGDLGIKGREAFSRESEIVPYTDEKRVWMEHHLYCCLEGIESLENHLKLQKWLRNHPDDVKAYSDLKKRLAQKYGDDIDSYVEDKTAFIVSCLKKSGMTTAALDAISLQNKKKASD